MTSLVAYLGLTKSVVSALCILMTLDFITGVIAVIRIDQKSFRSAIGRSKLFDKMLALAMPMAIIIAGHSATDLVGQEIGEWISWACSYFAGFAYLVIIFFEAMSILGNVVSTKRKERIAEVDATEIIYKGGTALLRNLVKWLQNSISKKIDLEVDEKDDK